jgi:hypothetical protein
LLGLLKKVCYITEGFRFQEVYHFTLIIFQLFICFDLLFDIYSMNELLMRFNEMNDNEDEENKDDSKS